MAIILKNDVSVGDKIIASDVTTDSDYLYTNKDTFVETGNKSYYISTSDNWSTKANEGGSVSGNGTYTYSNSSQTKSITATPDAGYSFSKWTLTKGSGASASGSTLTINAYTTGELEITADFVGDTYSIIKSTSPSAAGTISGPENYQFSKYSQTKEFTANSSSSDYVFSHWITDKGSFTDIKANPAVLNIPASTTGNINITADFIDGIILDSFQLSAEAGNSIKYLTTDSPSEDTVVLSYFSFDPNITSLNINKLT